VFYFYEDEPLRLVVDGQTYLDPTGNVSLPGGIIEFPNEYTWNVVNIIFRSSVAISIYNPKATYVTMLVSIPALYQGRVAGLCGTFDGNIANDYKIPNSTVLPEGSTVQELYYDFGLLWRVPQSESLFDYSLPTKDYNTVNPGVANPQFEANFTSQTLQNLANQICTGLGLVGKDLAACLFDIAATGDPSAADSSAINAITTCIRTTGASSCVFNANCPNWCSFHGTCSGSVCTCFTGYSGSDCSISSFTTSTSSTTATDIESSSSVLAVGLVFIVVALAFIVMM
jgi:hypothetical protein